MGILAALFGKKGKANNNDQYNVIVDLKNNLIQMQEFLIESLTEIKESLENESRAKFLVKADLFSTRYTQVVMGHHDLYRHENGDLNRRYRIFVTAAGPAWQMVSHYATGIEKDKSKVTNQIKSSLAVIAEVDLKRSEAA
jgi:hypothetical protein